MSITGYVTLRKGHPLHKGTAEPLAPLAELPERRRLTVCIFPGPLTRSRESHSAFLAWPFSRIDQIAPTVPLIVSLGFIPSRSQSIQYPFLIRLLVVQCETVCGLPKSNGTTGFGQVSDRFKFLPSLGLMLAIASSQQWLAPFS